MGWGETMAIGDHDPFSGESVKGGTSEIFVSEVRARGVRIDGMLDFSMLDLSGETFEPASCDLAEQVATACDALAPQARQRGIAFERGRSAPVRVGLGADSCTQALLNVLDNAVKYGREGGRVRIGWSVRLPYARIRVDDDGPGLGAPRRPGR